MNRREKPIETMLVLAMGCLLANVVFHWKAALWLSFGFGGIGIFSGWLSRQIDRVWMRLARMLGWLSNGVLLSVVFLVVVVPVAIFRRMLRKDRMTYFDQSATSNFVTRDHLFAREDLEKTW
jgi:Saxitoxin biosynthesis operon protein SxtJ